MTKKHFEWAAAYVRAMREAGAMLQASESEDAFADLFTRFGPRFDEPRFRKACRVAAAGERGTDARRGVA